jgi:hypothetical protein
MQRVQRLFTFVSLFPSVTPAEAGIQSLCLKDNGFPIATSGMTIRAFLKLYHMVIRVFFHSLSHLCFADREKIEIIEKEADCLRNAG